MGRKKRQRRAIRAALSGKTGIEGTKPDAIGIISLGTIASNEKAPRDGGAGRGRNGGGLATRSP